VSAKKRAVKEKLADFQILENIRCGPILNLLKALQSFLSMFFNVKHQFRLQVFLAE
jgi:hypothetical protein